MSREIKFRAWIADEDQMYSAEELSRIGANGGHPVCYYKKEPDGRRGYMTEHSGSSAIPMQYTSVKDKNGVEIYEGDILTGRNTLTPFTVSWRDGHGLMWHNVPQTWSEHLGGRDGSQYEVIGNIYENPELLTS